MLANNIMDYDKIQCKAVLRNRRNGDTIKFYNKSHTTKIKKLFNSEIPLNKRDEVIFIADQAGIIFVEGYGIADRVKVDNNTKRAVCINVFEGNV